MIVGPLIFIGIFAAILAGIFIIKKASLEGRIIIAFAFLSIAAYYRLHFYLLLLTSLSLIAFILVALVWAWIASYRIRVVREIKGEALAGENVPITYKVVSRNRLPLFHARIWDRMHRERSDENIEELLFEDPGYVSFLRIHPSEKSEGSLHFIPPARGLVKFGPLAIEGGDPFGIFTLTKWLPVIDECLVLPNWVRLNAMPPIPGRLGAREQERLISREGHSHEFLGIRPYTEGDSLRGVHWPLTAKHDSLIVRQFQREVEEEMLVILDADKRGDIGEGSENALEYLITLSLSLIHAASDAGRPWNLVIISESTDTISHHMRESLMQAQYSLAKLKANWDKPVEETLDDLHMEFPHAVCILLTPRTDEGPLEALNRWDSGANGIAGSILVRIDPDNFVTSVTDGWKAMKRRSEVSGAATTPSSAQVSMVRELIIHPGDNLADLFIGHATVK